MSNEIQHSGSTLAVHQDQQFWTDQQMAALQQLGVATNSQGDLAVFFHQAQKSGLDPFKREIYMITRKGKPTIQTGIDGFYKIADRVTTRTRGTWGISETYWCGADGQWVDVWLQQGPPAAAKVIVERNGSKFTTVALTSEYTATGPMWQKMPARMIAKCAEALAIRKAFPEDLSGLYTSDEMAQADNNQQAANRAPQQARTTRRPQQQVQSAPSPEPSGRNWEAELDDCATAQDVRNLWKACATAGELTDELKSTFQAAGTALTTAENTTEEEVVDGVLVDENGEIQGEAA
ncbi:MULTISPECIES: RecT family recombinase [unclassified Brevibacterium]|uniref:RecT family recombinase n=1 Tax=unclassified Brevibacterium TaxID=2614124 RepID=UPI001E5B9B9F|nr:MULTISPECIES: RecT family recombinase [unclassified Brevibacterium]MDK8436443.1 RecT family recombinase [Brevibacterium sp. H-BE7]